MSHYAIFVTVTLKPGMADAFLPLIMENARAAERDEPDCLQFKVMVSQDSPDVFHFFELYRSQAALDFHRQQPHFIKFRDGTQDMIAAKDIQGCHVVES